VKLDPTLRRSLLAEFLGSAFLAAVVIGSGIAAQRLSPGDVGLELFENAAATAAGLYTIILMFGPVSGAHLNPVVSLVDASFGGLSWRSATRPLKWRAAPQVRSPPTPCSRPPRSASRPSTARAARTCSRRRSRRSACCL
jgi:hypothetical protein